MPSGAWDAALWDIRTEATYNGVVATDGSQSSANASSLQVAGTGPASGTSFEIPGAQVNHVDNTIRFGQTAYDLVLNSTPGSGSILLQPYLRATSDGGLFVNGDEAFASIGAYSGLSYFSSDDGNVYSTDGIFLTVTMTPHLNFSGQTLNSNLQLQGGEELTGYGTVNGTVSGASSSTISVGPGTLTLGSPGNSGGFNFGGTLHIGNNTVNLLDANLANLGELTTISGGTLNATNGVEIGSTDELTGYGTVNGAIYGVSGSRISVSSGTLTLGNSGFSNGFNFDGILDIGSNSVNLLDADLANLGQYTSISGGTLYAANGVEIGSADELTGYGTVNAAVSGASGSEISASSGALTLGNPGDSSGFNFGGTLHIYNNTVNLLDADLANLGELTTINGGTLNATNGVEIGSTDRLTGYGTINTAVVTQGDIAGQGGDLRFMNHVTGAGDFSGNIRFSGTYSPDNSSDKIFFQNLQLDSTAGIEMEIGGLYDQIWCTGLLELDGTLYIMLRDGFSPQPGDTFTIMVYNELDDIFNHFNHYDGLDLDNGLHLSPVYDSNTLTLVTTPIPGAVWLLSSGIIGLFFVRRKFKK